MKPNHVAVCFVIALNTVFAPCVPNAVFSPCAPVQDGEDPKNSIRISEVSLDVGKMSSYTTFMFVEIFTPLATVPLNSVTVVIYGASKKNVLAACPCDQAVFNELGYAQCSCGTPLFETQEFVGAVALHNADQANFPVGALASSCGQIGLIDAVLWQSYGNVMTNPLQSYFAQGQVYHYQPPAAAAAYSINRCYGDPLTNQRWQASFSISDTATPNGPNICMPPSVIVNEINFNKAFVEIMSSKELPLDNVTIAFVQEKDSTATIVSYYSLINQRTESNSFFTIGKMPSDYFIPGWTLPTNSPVAVVVYFNITIQGNTIAPSTNVLHSIVYGDTNGVTVPALKGFSDTTYAIDTTGTCSLSVCNGNPTDIQLAQPSFNAPNDCTVQCSP